MLKRNFILISLSLIAFTLFSCKHTPAPKMMEIKLASGWSFHKVGEEKWYPASVPGDLVSDLWANSMIDDPYFGTNASNLKWIQTTNWEYKCTFDVARNVLKYRKLSLKFEGLDTYADVYLNDTLILKADNMFCQWEIPCKHLLKERGNNLRVFFHPEPKSFVPSPDKARRASLGDARDWIRKAQFEAGSSFNPSITNYGVWKKISLCAWNNARITDVYLYPSKVSESLAEYVTWIDIEAEKNDNYTLAFWVNDELVESSFPVHLKQGANHQKFEFKIEKPELWWCNGMGKQPIYQLRVELSQKGTPISGTVQPFGIRSIELVQDSGTLGDGIYFKLNGKKLFIKGTTIVPIDLLRAQVKGKRIEDLVNSVADANMNMIRIPQNSLYENDSLYECCDKKGILVWQDIISPPATEIEDYNHFEQEVRQNLIRLRNHPSMALWNTDQEANPLSPSQKKKRGSDDQIPLSEGWLPAMVSRYASHIPYYVSNGTGLNQKDWGVWNNAEPIDKFVNGRFISQYGMQSFPCMRSLKSFANEDEIKLQSPTMIFHQRAYMPWISSSTNGNQMINNYIQMYYNDPPYFESFIYLSQILQAQALKEAVESHRTNRPQCSGSMFYHYNDCWPGITWSVVDYYGRKKAAWYSLRKANANVMVTARKSENDVSIYTVNDSLMPVQGIIKLQIMNFDGKKLWAKTIPVSVPAGSSVLQWKVPADRICPENIKAKVFLLVQFESGKTLAGNILYFTEPMYLDLPLPDITYTISGNGEKYDITLVSDKFAPNVWLSTDMKDSQFSENNFFMLPNHPQTLSVEYNGTREELETDLQITSLVNSY